MALELAGCLAVIGDSGIAAFVSGAGISDGKTLKDALTTASHVVVYVGGLTDNLLSKAYLVPLSAAIGKTGGVLVQPQLSSAGLGYGTSSLAQDVLELAHLCLHLEGLTVPGRLCPVFLVGHSTGCQDCLVFARCLAEERALAGGDAADSAERMLDKEMEAALEASSAALAQHESKGGAIQGEWASLEDGWRARVRRFLRGIVLQAPVSDREYMATAFALSPAAQVQVRARASNIAGAASASAGAVPASPQAVDAASLGLPANAALDECVSLASSLLGSDADALLPRGVDMAPMSCRRFLALACKVRVACCQPLSTLVQVQFVIRSVSRCICHP